METELFVTQVTFDIKVDKVPWQRTYHVVTTGGPIGAMNAALERLAARVTANPEEKITEMIITKIHKDNFVLSDIKEKHTDGRAV